VEFVNGAGSSIDIVWVPPDGQSPKAVEVSLSPGDMKPIVTWEGHRFRAVSRDGTICNGDKEFVVKATHPLSFRHVFCAGPDVSPADDIKTQPIARDGRPRQDYTQSAVDHLSSQIRRRVEFVNGAGSSIDIVFVPPDGPSPEAVEVNLSPGDMRPIYTWEGHRFRAVSRDGISCNGETDFVVEATHPRFYRHVFCAGHVASPTDDKGTPPVEWDGHPIDEL
jgi:hypothetical protein